MTSSLDRALDRLARLHPKRIDLSLGRCHRLLDGLGRPQDRLPPVIHVAGTNGKGSTVAFLRAFLEAAGRTVHVYTSPHLVRFSERIRLGGQLIDDDRLVDILDRCERVNGADPITFFEVTTAAALTAFAETPADIVLLEVGLGGRLDATNVVERPLATAITRVSRDHMQFLGDTIDDIAGEKAGIAKAGVPLVVGPQKSAAARQRILRQAAAAGAPVDLAGRDWHVSAAPDGGFMIEDDRGRRRFPAPALEGRHQLDNAATSIRVAGFLDGLAPSSAAIESGLSTVNWPGRLAPLARGPLVEALAPGATLWLDGGHNDSAGEALAAWLRACAPGPADLVVGMLDSKDPEAFLRPLAPVSARLTATEIPDEKASLPPEALADIAGRCGFRDVDVCPYAALGRAVAAAASPTVLLCGSLYLAGKVLRDHSPGAGRGAA